MNTKVAPYRAVDFSEKAIRAALKRDESVIANVKYDGVRGLWVIRHNAPGDAYVKVVSREGIPINALVEYDSLGPSFADFIDWPGASNPNGCILDTELMVKGVSFQTSSGILRSMYVKEDNLKYHKWPEQVQRTKNGKIKAKQTFCLDPKHLEVRVIAVLPLEALDDLKADVKIMNCVMEVMAETAVNELDKHVSCIDWKTVETYTVFDFESLQELFEQVRLRGLEGLIVKTQTGYYRRGKVGGWWKMKPDDEVDGEVVGLVWGTEGKANEGKVIGFEVLLEDGTVVNATNIPQSLMEEFTAKVIKHNGGPDVEFLRWFHENNPYHGWKCTVKFMEYTDEGSLRHPSWHCWRGQEGSEKVKQ